MVENSEGLGREHAWPPKNAFKAHTQINTHTHTLTHTYSCDIIYICIDIQISFALNAVFIVAGSSMTLSPIRTSSQYSKSG